MFVSELLMKEAFESKTYRSIWQEPPTCCIDIYKKNAPTVLRNQTVLNNLPRRVYSREPNGKFLDDCSCAFSVIQAAQNQKQKNTGG